MKMTLQDKHHFERTEKHFGIQLVDWDNIQIVKEEDLPEQAREAYQQNLSKLALQKQLEQEFLSNPIVKLFDDYILELLMDYHLNESTKSENAKTIYDIVVSEYKQRSSKR